MFCHKLVLDLFLYIFYTYTCSVLPQNFIFPSRLPCFSSKNNIVYGKIKVKFYSVLSELQVLP